jgi:RNA polymerase sigma factor (sigma-70 family)
MTDAQDDEDLAIRMMCGDKEALRIVLERHLEHIKALLQRIYGTTVQALDLEEAVSRATFTMWRKAGAYDKEKGTLRAWFFTLAQRAVIDIYRREKRHRRRSPLLPEDYDVPELCDPQADEPLTPDQKKELKDVDHVIEHKLKGHQKAIVKADLLVGEAADAGSLAEMLNTTKESIYVSRNKAHENIRKEMTQLDQTRERLRGKK